MHNLNTTDLSRKLAMVLCLIGSASIFFHPEWRALVAASYEVTEPTEVLNQEEEAVEERLEKIRNEPYMDLPRWGIFATASYGETERDTTEREIGFDSEVSGITVGADYRVNSDVVLGAAISAFDEESVLLENTGTVDYRAYSYSIYGGFTPTDNSYIDFLAGFTEATYTGTRNANSGPIDSEYDGLTGRVAINAGYNLSRGPWTIGPLVALNYASIENDDKIEEGDSTDAVSVKGRTKESLMAKLGVNVSHALSFAWGVLSPNAALIFQHEFRDDAANVETTNISSGEVSFFLTDEPDRDTMIARFGVAAALANNLNFFIAYDQLFLHDYKETRNVNLGVRLEF